MSTPAEDAKGIDIVAWNTKEKVTFQVGGNYMKGKKIMCTYYVQVTEKKIYIKKGGTYEHN